ncbi:MAG: phosphoribosyltransferase [Infirmifilum sp.]|jgi:hypoxanthine phosphoribosyltransferase|uniref:phosphoribosyltransferase n=1 Tax=Infirmifilum TaxID=2856573 RepID=UPI0023569FEB
MVGGSPKITTISWSELFSDTLELAKRIISSGFIPERLIVVVRGGLVVGRILSDLLQVKELVNLPVSFYKGVGTTRDKPVISADIDESTIKGRSVLIVDDIVDTGETLKAVLAYVESLKPRIVRSAAPYVKPWANPFPDYYVKIVEDWVVFPYELRETMETLPANTAENLGLDEKTLEEIKTLIGMFNAEKEGTSREPQGNTNGLL